MIRRSLFAAVLLAVAAVPVRAQSISSPYDFVDASQSIRGFAGYVLTDRGAIDIGPGSSWATGVGYTIRVSGPFNVDVRAALMPTSRRVFDTVDVPAADSARIVEDPTIGLEQIGTADLALLMLDGALRFDITGPRTWNGLQPYALLGVGGVLTIASDNAIEEELPQTGADLRVRFGNGFTGSIGLGVEWYASDRFSVVAEARDILWQIDAPTGFLEGPRVIDDSEWVQTAHLSLGLGYRF